MSSAKDFKLISWKNGLGLSGIVVAVLIPVGIRYYFRSDIASIQEVEREEEDGNDDNGAVVGTSTTITHGAGPQESLLSSPKTRGGTGLFEGGDGDGRSTRDGDDDDDETPLLEGLIVQTGGPPTSLDKGKKTVSRDANANADDAGVGSNGDGFGDGRP